MRPYIRKNSYRWHRLTSLVVALPILMWTISGFLHPVMSAFKPAVSTNGIQPKPLDLSLLPLSLAEALQKNGIESLSNFRVVLLEGKAFYQVQRNGDEAPLYLSAATGSPLPQGDARYAAELALRLLTVAPKAPTAEGGHHSMGLQLSQALPSVEKKKAPQIVSLARLSSFTSEYRSSNVLLPVYCVSFRRADELRLYVDTRTDRLATAMDNRRAAFTRFFAAAHSWSFLDGMGPLKSLVLGLFAALCFISSLAGLYVYNLTGKKKGQTKRLAAKSLHRILGNVFAATTLLFAFSGAWHSFHKLSSGEESHPVVQTTFTTRELIGAASFTDWAKNKKLPLENVSLVRLNGVTYWQLFSEGGKQKHYVPLTGGAELSDGEKAYAQSLALAFSGQAQKNLVSSGVVNAFSHRYSMMNKRLPVQELVFQDGSHYFVETATGTLAAVTKGSDAAERFSFSNLHMHHYWEMGLGKTWGTGIKNVVLCGSTLGLLLVACSGIWIWTRRRMRKPVPAGKPLS